MIDRKIALVRYVARRGSFTQAAKELGVAQSTISRDISLLENEVRTPLFERHREGITLTPAGRHLRGLIFGKMDDRIIEDCRRVAAGCLPVLYLSMGMNTAILIQPVLERLAAMGLDMPVQTSVYKNCDIRLLLQTGQADAGFVFGSEAENAPGLSLLYLGNPRWLVAAREDHAYWAMTPEDRSVLLRQVVITNEENFPSATNSGSIECSARYCVDHGLPFRYFLKANFLQDQIVMLQAGLGVALVPPTTAACMPPGIRVSDELAIPFSPDFVLVSRSDSRHPGLRILQDLCREYFRGESHE